MTIHGTDRIDRALSQGRDAAHLAHRMRYVATREGVELLTDQRGGLPATKKQQAYIRRLIRTFPEAAELLEYDDYRDQPTQERANEFIRQARESFVESMDQRENFLDYIAHRPGVQLSGEHGLWDAQGKVRNLAAAVREVAEHPGNVWTPVIALRREDAERLGYWTAKKYLRGSDTTPPDYERAYRLLLLEAKDGNAQAMCDLGRIYREGLVPDCGPAPEKARDWYAKALAAFREKEQATPNSRTEYRIARMYADGLGVEADDAEAEHWFRLAAEKENLFAQNALASLLLKQGKPEEAALWLERAAKQGNPAAQYALGRLHLLGTGVPQDRVLAMELLGRSAAQGDSRAAELAKEPERVSILPAAMAVTRMLHHMSRIFEHNCKQDQVFQGLQIDRKRWRELQELRIAMGHMPDDHEEIEISLR